MSCRPAAADAAGKYGRGGCTDSEKEFNSTEPFRLFSKFRTSKLDAEEEPPKNQMKPVMDVQVVIGEAEKAVAEATAAAHKIPFIKKTSKEEDTGAGSGPANGRLSISTASSASGAERREAKPTSLSNCDKLAVIKPEPSRAKMGAKPDATAVKAIKKEIIESKYSTPNRYMP